MKNLYKRIMKINLAILFLLITPASLSLAQQSSPVIYPDDPISFKRQFIERSYRAERNIIGPGNPIIANWQGAIDSTWGWGETKAEKQRILDQFCDIIDREFACFNGINVNWDSLRAIYRAEIDTGHQTFGVSRGRFAGIMHNLSIQLRESHTSIDDKTISWYTPLAPGIPLLYVGAWGNNGHFGAGLTMLEDSTLLVYKTIPDHPLRLERGDVVLGYNGILWKDLYRQLLEAQLPTTGNWWGSSTSSFTHSWMISAGMNWHLSDTIDIVKYNSGDTVHLSTEPLANLNADLWCTEQMDIRGVPMPDYYTGQRASYGIVEGTQIGYIYVIGWSGSAGQEFYDAVYDLMNNYQTTGLIIDFRTNFGGNMFLGDPALSLLFNTEVITIDFAERCDPDDHFALCPFGYYRNYIIAGAPSSYYDKPIAVLTGPGAYSAGDQVAFRFKFHPMARFFGKSTSTAFNSPVYFDVGNIFWNCVYAPFEAYLYDNINHYLTHRELEVDEEVWLTKADVAQGHDTVVDAAIEWINSMTAVNEGIPIPRNMRSLACYPNPFNATTIIEFMLAEASHAQLSIYDLMGREVAVLANGSHQPGNHKIIFDASNLSSGVYFCVLRAEDKVETNRMILLK
ncbi:MAG: T9SS type A sorting domain-containing protein [Candidatus Zixiibacteriota bacterium]|nr:MAG: T9SS type A sorting domain-containing protein [candidate division Zixibacteria bacterium]